MKMLHRCALTIGRCTTFKAFSNNRSFKFLSKEQVDQFHNDGYLIINNLLSKGEVSEARQALEKLIDRSKTITTSDDIFELQDEHTREQPKVERVRYPSEQHPVFKSILRHKLLLDAVEDLIGSSFRYMPQDKLNVKPAGHGRAIRWHQDWAFFPHTNDSLLTASVLLYDSKRENGCLQVIPKSHRGPIKSHFYDGKFVSTITDKNFKAENPVYLEAPAGSVTLHHVRIIHGSAKNTSTLPRSVVCYIYNSMDAWPLLGVAGSDFMNTGPVDFELFDKTRLRGEQCITPRLENVPVQLPVPFDLPSTVFDMQFDVDEPQP